MGAHDVLVTDGEWVRVGRWMGEAWECAIEEGPFDSVVTHWMELPELPEV